jgi:transcription elongation factor Elf1
MILENCPICNAKLQSILDNDGFVIDYWCGKCNHSWTLEDLEITDDQETMDKWF